VFSNGLYLWTLRRPANEGAFPDREAAYEFVKDFRTHHLNGLIHGSWGKGQIGEKNEAEIVDYTAYEKSYRGILTYHQIEILFDAVFNFKLSLNSFFHHKDSPPPAETATVMDIMNQNILYYFDSKVYDLDSGEEALSSLVFKDKDPKSMLISIADVGKNSFNWQEFSQEASEEETDRHELCVSYLSNAAME
jgi:hypothetical protein